MNVLHLQLYLSGETAAQLRFFSDNPNDYEERSLSLHAIADLIEQAEDEYYFPQDSRLLRRGLSAEKYAETGKLLYDWLDGSDRLLTRSMQQYSGEGLVLAIDASQKLAHLPWEVLHDGCNFLVARVPAVVPMRWVSSDSRQLSIATEPENRALQVLFMATSPLGVKPELQFEAEEGRILEATARQPLALVVEESGCLTELGYLIDDYGKDYFDVLHLTGHATITEEREPRFYTETETGELYLASAEDIAKSLKSRLPQLIFLSGCRTGQGGKLGAVPSLAEGLLKLGAKAVLGWGQTVLDTEATAAAAALYGELAAGYELTEALSQTYQALIQQKARDWHLLRLYVGRALPGQLVTHKGTRGRKPAPKPSVAEQFLDVDTKQVKVASRGSFVGRRRQLQSCLRALKPPSQDAGVLIHGMGGLGKSTLAARLCDRLPEFERIVWVGRVDEGNLVKRLTEKLRSKELRQLLQSYDDELKFRLRDVFAQLEEEAAQPFLLVLDDFEGNLEPCNHGYVLQPEAARVLEALLWAIEETYARHRVILTCRYDFESEWLQKFYKQPMDGLQGADLEKKCNRLSAFGVNSPVDEALRAKALRLADGNPRLLEWLDKVLLDATVDRGAILQRLAAYNRVELREKVLATSLLEQIDGTLEEILRRGLVYELPVPREAIIAICTNCRDGFRDNHSGNTDNSDTKPALNPIEEYLNRAVALGLLEVSPDASLRVPRILPLKLPEDAESLHQQAAEVLYRLWWEEAETSTEEQRLEIHRLALFGKEEKIALQVAGDLANSWYWSNRFREVVKICTRTTEVFQNYRILHELARSEEQLGDIKNCMIHYQQALKLCPKDNTIYKSAIINNLAVRYQIEGQLDEALDLHQQSLDAKESIGDAQGKATALHNMARIYLDKGQEHEAMTLFQKSLQISERIGFSVQKAATLSEISYILVNKGKFTEALEKFQIVIEISRKIGNVYYEAVALMCIGDIYKCQGQVKAALTFYQQSLELEERIGDVYGKAVVLGALGELAEQQGEFEIALSYWQQALDLFQRIQASNAESVRRHIDRVQQQIDNRGNR